MVNECKVGFTIFVLCMYAISKLGTKLDLGNKTFAPTPLTSLLATKPMPIIHVCNASALHTRAHTHTHTRMASLAS